AQAANTLATLGLTTLVHLTGCSPEQAAAFDHPNRTLVPTTGELKPVGTIACETDPTMWHVSLEYAPGLTARVGERAICSRAHSRIIVSYDPVNANVQLREEFVEALLSRPDRIRRLLLSGYSQVVDQPRLDRLLAQSIAAVLRWRAAHPRLEIHIEL